MSDTVLLKLPKSASHSYPIMVGSGMLKNLETVLRKIPAVAQILKSVSNVVIITDSHVKKLYGDELHRHLRKAGLKTTLIFFAAGEKSKNENIKTRLDHALLAKKFGRDTLVLALGGGVAGDMAGFVAATYMRGIPYIHLPTTLLAMVDSSIGGKVGIDTPFGKNLLGAFHHPLAVITDVDCLKSLTEKQRINGLFEAIKIFLTNDGKFFKYTFANLEKILNHDQAVVQKIILRAIQLKTAIIQRDEREGNERMIVNYGHTIGHALEHLSDYKLLHGFAVALGILVENRIAWMLGILSSQDEALIAAHLQKLGIHAGLLRKFKVVDIIAVTHQDKKKRGGHVQYVLLKTIGKVHQPNGNFALPVKDKLVITALNTMIHP